MRRLAVMLLFFAAPALAGGPPQQSPDEAHARARQARREAEAERTWKALGRRAIPRLVKTACGNNPTAVDLVDNAALALADHGADAARVIYATRRECGRYVEEVQVGKPREELLAEVYCAMAGPFEELSAADAKELARWASVVMDGTHRDNRLAVAALFETLERSCAPKIYKPMLPVLTGGVGQMLRSSHRNVSGTFRLRAMQERHQAALAAIGASREGTKTLIYVYGNGSLSTKVLVVAALERAGPSAAEALPQIMDFLRLTSDDESRFLALRALAALDVSLTPSNARLIGAALSEFLGRVKPPAQGVVGTLGRVKPPAQGVVGTLGRVKPPAQGVVGNRLEDVWPQLAAARAILILSKSRVESGAQRALIGSLRAPLERGGREVAARKLLAGARALSPADRRCAEETLSEPRRPLPAGPNAVGPEYAPSWTPPASCRIPAN